MDSLVANYASSEEEGEGEEQPSPTPTTKSSSIFSSLPQPKEPPKNPKLDFSQKPPTSTPTSSSIFSSLPKPQLSTSTNKRVVKFTPPILNNSFHDDDDEDDEQKQANKHKESQSVNQSSSVKSFLSTIPAPKSSATLGVASSGRRSILETQIPALSSTNDTVSDPAERNNENYEASVENYELGSDQTVGNYANYEASVENYANYDQSSVSYANHDQSSVSYANYEQSVENYEVGSDQNVDIYNWGVDQSSYVNCGSPGNGMVPRKRGRNEIPTEIIEVKQDELIKNRPREDQAKLTGIAFGPSYQPVSTKGKPSKLHKRKHQIGSLYYDMKQKEAELTERRAKGFMTKAQTQGKYGW